RRVTPAELSAYEMRERGEPWLASYLAGSSMPVFDLAALARCWMIPEADLHRQAETSPELRTGPSSSKGPTRSPVWRAEYGTQLLERLRGFVERQPRGEQSISWGLLGRELRVRSAQLHPLLQCLLELDHPTAKFLRAHTRLEKAGLLLFPGMVAFSPEEQRIADRILEQLEAEGLRPSRIQELRQAHADRPDRVDRVLAKLRDAGRVVAVSADFVLHRAAVEELRRAPVRHNLDGVRAAEFGKALGLSRKYSIPFLEYLNREGILRRDGDLHYLA
ncbi:MAG TPA: SelB C-terminal domain-containing protein, partial [Longimicrobiaceae bacterium]|nr:SelB C-terminal domain-containing protein [Longimicrobiaceae bacterium]